MLKFIKHHMDTIAGIGIYPVLSFLIFFSIFCLALLYVWRVRRSHIDHMAALPLNDGPNAPDTERHER
ncbi:MAG: CcoQ/FixQ family Cbb3-type cytochrome c oxidase assembly chaperone [Flavobacteriales bacterium]|jgi:cbb3-type cytochrome oxidase subunit 3|nr:CcoQ/FixQ family Cbb3-type cytochrome c oxidase assembly chaperone [Flavobacteriales bacterium]